MTPFKYLNDYDPPWLEDFIQANIKAPTVRDHLEESQKNGNTLKKKLANAQNQINQHVY
jgi:hypothetical protein